MFLRVLRGFEAFYVPELLPVPGYNAFSYSYTVVNMFLAAIAVFMHKDMLKRWNSA